LLSVIAKMARVSRTCVCLLWGFSLLAQITDPGELFQEAVEAQQRGDDATAVLKYRELLRTHPDAALARVNLGATLAHLKRYDDAIAQYRIVLAADHTNRPARLNLALAYQEKGDLARAVQELEALHRNQPGDLQTALLLADCSVRLQHYAQAIAVLMPLEAREPDNLDLAWLLGTALIRAARPQEGVELVEKVALRANNADAYLLAGETRLNLDQYDLARRHADAAMRLDPALAGLQTLNGMILEHTGDYDRSEAALEQAARSDPTDFNAHLYLGSILYFKRDMDGARLHLQRALELQPESAQARYKLALVERSEGHLDMAVKDLEVVLRQSPAWIEPHAELAAIYYRLHRPEDGARERLTVDRLMAAQPREPIVAP
jgi:tetratricopeptide (TPR) repeat protein